MSKEMQRDRGGFMQFVLGFVLGAIVFIVVAAVATLLQDRLPRQYCVGGARSNCIPVVEYAVLRAASWGPASVFSLARTTRALTPLQWQGISCSSMAVLAGVISVVPPRKSTVEIFLVVYALLVGLTAFLIVLVIATG